MTLSIATLPPPPVRGEYARHVIESGHIPGVLSGAELRGRARRYSGWYHHARQRVMQHAAAHGVHARLLLDPDLARWVRVWADESGQPVRVVVRDDA